MESNSTSSNNVSITENSEQKPVGIQMIILGTLAVIVFLLFLYCLCPWPFQYCWKILGGGM